MLNGYYCQLKTLTKWKIICFQVKTPQVYWKTDALQQILAFWQNTGLLLHILDFPRTPIPKLWLLKLLWLCQDSQTWKQYQKYHPRSLDLMNFSFQQPRQLKSAAKQSCALATPASKNGLATAEHPQGCGMLPSSLLFLTHRTLQCLQFNSRSKATVPLAPGGGALSEGQRLQKICIVKIGYFTPRWCEEGWDSLMHRTNPQPGAHAQTR